MADIRPVLKQLFEAYPNNKASEGTVAMYYRLLQDIPPDDLQMAVDQCIASSRFLPTIAELRETWHSLTRTLGQQSAAEAWADVEQQIRETGYIGSPQFDNPTTAAVVKSMGWRNICASEQPYVERAQFMRMYDQWVQRNANVQRLLPQAREFAEQRQPGLRRLGDVMKALPEWKVADGPDPRRDNTDAGDIWDEQMRSAFDTGD